MTKLSVVIPTKNEEKSICIEKIQRVFNEHHIDGEIIIADNSLDNTPEIAKGMGAKVIVPGEHGYGNAYRFLFEEASGDYIVMGDGDNTYDFMDIPKLLEPLKRGEADLVLGWLIRVISESRPLLFFEKELYPMKKFMLNKSISE